MKKFMVILMCLFVLIVTMSCSDNKEINGVKYETYGLINQDDVKSDCIKYKPCWGEYYMGNSFI